MATKKKKSTKTAKRTTSASKTHKKAASRTNCKKSCELTSRDKFHVCVVASLSIIAGILLCADAAMMIVA